MWNDARVLILIGLPPIPEIFIEKLYEMGVRKDRFMIFGMGTNMAGMLVDENVTDAKRELGPGTIQIQPKPWIGEFGKVILKDLEERGHSDTPSWKPIAYSCHSYDIPLGLSYTFDRMLTTGKTFENTTELRQSYRENRYSGCSGLIIHISETNNRVPAYYDISQV